MDGFQVRGLGAVGMVFMEVRGFEGEVLEVRRFAIEVFSTGSQCEGSS